MIYVLGTRTTSSEVADLQEQPWAVAGYVENQWHKKIAFAGKPVYWWEDIPTLGETALFVCGIASSFHRRAYVESVEARYRLRWWEVRHPSAAVSATAKIGDGCIFSRLVAVASNTKLGRHCFLNRGVLLGHDCTVGDFVTFSPGANVAGCCTIGDGAYIAMGAIVVDRTVIGANAFVAAGAVVTQDVPPNTAVRGVPAKPFRLREGSRVLDRIDASKYELHA